MIRFEFSDEHQQYNYYVTIKTLDDLRQVTFEINYQGPKFPDVISSKQVFFLNKNEWNNFKDIINAVV